VLIFDIQYISGAKFMQAQ